MHHSQYLQDYHLIVFDAEGKHLGDHYDATVNIEIPNEEEQSEEKETNGQQSEEICEAQDCPININKENNTSKSKQNKYREEKVGEKKKYEKHSPYLHLFTNVIPVVTDQIPWGVDGTSIYQIRCDEQVLHDKQKDGRWWRMLKSTRVSLNGPRKFGVCNGSNICENPECTKVTTEGVQNKIEFKQEKGRGYTCKCCWYYVQKRYCGFLKAREYDKNASLLTIYHQGEHICTAKPDVIPKKKYAESNILDHNLHSTPKEMKIG